jgi:hypothetical protein
VTTCAGGGAAWATRRSACCTRSSWSRSWSARTFCSSEAETGGVAEEYGRALHKPVSYVDVPWDTWAEQTLPYANLGPYVEEHLATMARLHRENRYDRVTTTVEEVTGQPAESVEEFVTRRSDLFAE